MDHTIQMKKNTEGVWDNLYPLSKTTNIFNKKGKSLDDILQETDEKLNAFDKVKLDMLGFYDEFEVETYRDDESETTYHLAMIPVFDKDGNKIKIQHSHTAETYVTSPIRDVREFSSDIGASLAINASTFSSTTNRLVGVYLKDGVSIQNLPVEPYNYTLAIDDDNNMRSFPPNTDTNTILSKGYNNAISTFIPLIENGSSVSDSVINTRDIFNEPHPRSAIAKDSAGNTYFFVSEGRMIGEFGMYAKDVIRVLQQHGMVFAQMLDGGGSSQMTAYHTNVNRVSGNMGAEERNVGNALFIAKEEVNETANQILGIVGESTMRVFGTTQHLNRMRYQRNNYIEMGQYLVNGWKNFGTEGSSVCRGWILPNNTLYLVGTITGGELDVPFMQLPDNVKPMFTTHHLVVGDKENEIYKVIIGADGTLQWYYWTTEGRPPNTNGSNYIKLDGIFIPLDTPEQGIQ